MEGTKVLTTAEFAEIMGVTDRCVRKWCERGAVKASRSGSRSPWRIQFNEKRFREIADENAAMNSQMAAERGKEMSDNALVLLTLSPILIGIVIPAVVEFAGAVA